MRRVWIALGCLVALAIVAATGFGLWVRGYLRSEAFRQLIESRTGQALKSTASLEPLSWSGPSVFSPGLQATGLPHSMLETLDAQQVRAEINWRAIFDGAWKVEQIDIQRLDATISTAPRPPRPEEPPKTTAPKKRGFLPDRFELGAVNANEVNLDLGDFAEIRKTTASLRPEGNGWLLEGAGGSLQIPARPPLGIDDCRIRIQQGVAYITEAHLRLGRNGAISASGEIGGGDFDVLVNWQGVDAADVLDETWRRRLTGTLEGHANSVGGSGRAPLTTGDFRLTDGKLEGLPLQSDIATFTHSPQFEHMPVHETSGKFQHEGDNTTVTGFVLESKGLVRVEGSCKIGPANAIDGDFEVGVTSQTLRWLPGSQEKVFTTPRDGYLWTTVHVGGTADSPTEDLSPRLAKAMGEKVIDTGMELLEGAPDKAGDTINKAIDILSPLLH